MLDLCQVLHIQGCVGASGQVPDELEASLVEPWHAAYMVYMLVFGWSCSDQHKHHGYHLTCTRTHLQPQCTAILPLTDYITEMYTIVFGALKASHQSDYKSIQVTSSIWTS